ncbi:hypothetical protein K440DRAFT_661546 [Wilcoxina mikolae CBS 423.85]|nr:hypothetical protein K440DRAFT_661546 [Wilcoxina mikolae CBS 423.85]
MQNTRIFVLDDNDEGVPPPSNQRPLDPNHVLSYCHPLHRGDEGRSILSDDDSDEDEGAESDGGSDHAAQGTGEGRLRRANTDLHEELTTADEINRMMGTPAGKVMCFPPQGTFARILEYHECALARDFFSAVETHMQLPEAPEQLLSERLATGVWIQGMFSPDGIAGNEQSTLFVSLPYLGDVPYNSENPESVRLSDFDGVTVNGTDGAISAPVEGELVVHQARFIVYNNTTIATFKSKESTKRIHKSVFPGDTQGAFHLLARMVRDVVTSDQTIIASFRKQLKSSHSIARLQALTSGIIHPADVEGGSPGDRTQLLQGISEDLERLVLITSVIKRQVEVVDDLIMNFHNSCIVEPDDLRVRMPVISNHKEQILAALPVLRWASERRGKVLKELKEIFTPLKRSHDHAVQLLATPSLNPAQTLPIPPLQAGQQTPGSEADLLTGLRNFTDRLADMQNEEAGARRSLLHYVMLIQQATTNIANVNEAERAKATAESLRDLLFQILNTSASAAQTQHEAWKSQEVRMAQQAADADLLRNEITWQGEQMSMFVAVTTIFLPLAFFTQYFAMDSAKPYATTQGRFWLITLPITLAFIAGVILMIIKKNHDNDELAKCFRSIRYLGRMHDGERVQFYRPKTRAEVRKIKDKAEADRRLMEAVERTDREKRENERLRQADLERQRQETQREEARKRASVWSIGNGSVASASATTTVPGITATRLTVPAMADSDTQLNEKMVVKVSAEDDVVKVSAESDSMMLTVSAGASPRRSVVPAGDESAASSDTRGAVTATRIRRLDSAHVI